MVSYHYWHQLIDAHPEQMKKFNVETKEQLKKIIVSFRDIKRYRVQYRNLKTNTKSWVDVKYIGRLPITATPEEIDLLFVKWKNDN